MKVLFDTNEDTVIYQSAENAHMGMPLLRGT